MKSLFTVFLLSLSLFAISFEEFRDKAMQKSFLLQKSQLQIQKNILQREKSLRKSNPEFEGNIAKYGLEDGFELTVKLPYRLDSFLHDLKASLQKNILVAKYQKALAKKEFVKGIETLYTKYIYQMRKTANIKQEISIQHRLLSIAKEKYRKGFGKKIDILKIESKLLTLSHSLYEQKQKAQKALYELYKFAALEYPIDGDKFLYSFDDFKLTKIDRLFIQQLDMQKSLSLAQSEVYRHNLQNIDLVLNYEKEPESEIVRAGISFAFPLFKKEQERRIALLNAKEMEAKKEAVQKALEIYKSELQKRFVLLQNRAEALQKARTKLQNLLHLYEESYRIDRSSLLDLISAKDELIATQNALLKILYEVNILVIEANYLKGNEHD